MVSLLPPIIKAETKLESKKVVPVSREFLLPPESRKYNPITNANQIPPRDILMRTTNVRNIPPSPKIQSIKELIHKQRTGSVTNIRVPFAEKTNPYPFKSNKVETIQSASYPKSYTIPIPVYSSTGHIISKIKKEKFEVCFKRSMNAMKGGINGFSKDLPSMNKIGKKLNKLPMKKMYKWEKKLGSHAHANLENSW